MVEGGFRRRDVLRTCAWSALTIGALGLSVHVPAARGEDRPEAAAALERMARLLYPHDAMPDAVYADVVGGLLGGADAPTRALLDEGAGSLAAEGWLERSEAEQLAALKAIEATPFFAAARAGVQAGLYTHPAMWAHLGYPGPSLPFGGYWDKGFGDIDWLPEGE